jgi:tetratricopeptide (TPR) repeat protein
MKRGLFFVLVWCLIAPAGISLVDAAEADSPARPMSSPDSPQDRENASPAVHDAFAQIIQGNFEEALRLSDEAIAQNPADPNAYIAKSLALASLGDNDEALISADKALEIDPASGAAYFAKATALLRMGKGDQAQESFKKACDLGETRACKFLK